MKLDMLSLLTALSACVFLARDAFAIPVPNAAASYHHVKRMENFEPILDWAVEAGSSSAHALTDGDNAVHAGASLTSAQDPHSLAQPIRGYGMQHASNDGPYFRTRIESPYPFGHLYGEPDVEVTRHYMPVRWTSMSDDERLVRQPGDEHVAGPSTRPLSPTEYFQRLEDVEIVQEGERLLREALARGQYSSGRKGAYRIGEADARLESWLLEVFRRRIKQVIPDLQSVYARVRWSFVDDTRQTRHRAYGYKTTLGLLQSDRPPADAPADLPADLPAPRETSVAFGPFDEEKIISPLQPFDIGAFRYYFKMAAPIDPNIGADRRNTRNIYIFFSQRDDPGAGVVSFGKLWVTPAPRPDDNPDALVNQ